MSDKSSKQKKGSRSSPRTPRQSTSPNRKAAAAEKVLSTEKQAEVTVTDSRTWHLQPTVDASDLDSRIARLVEACWQRCLLSG